MIAVASMTLAVCAGVLLAAYERPAPHRRTMIGRLSLALIVAAGATVAALVVSAILS